MDNPSESTSTAPLDTNGAAALFADMLEPKQETAEEQKKDEAKPEPQAEKEPAQSEVQAEEQSSEDDPIVTVKIDGQDVEVKLSELKNGYQRQADYTRKTMEAADKRKAAEAELQQARAERERYSQGLQQTGALLQAQLAEQNQIDWQKLLESDPVEFLKQKHLAEQRQAQLHQVIQAQQHISAVQQAEAEKFRQSFLTQQHAELLAKLPEWKDEGKAKAEKEALRNFLTEMGFSKEEVGNVSDHRAILMARKAMRYDQMMASAQAAAKKVEKLPQKVERPGGGEPSNLDKRSAAFQRLNKSGRVEDAAAVFAQFV